MIFGTSFSPEYCEYIGIKDPLLSLKFIHEELGINDIRLGMRWNMVDNGKSLSLSYYEKYLEYLFKNNINICLNVGPIKTFRWPEEHVPEYLNNSYTKYVDDSSQLASYSKEYFGNLLDLLDRAYGDNIKDVQFQIENESFNRFGHIATKMSPEYIFSLVSILFGKYPTSTLMMNSAGRNDLYKVVDIFKRIRLEPSFNPKCLILGFNYYFRIPNVFPFIQNIDPIRMSYPWNMSISELKKQSRDLNFHIEVSEGQFEPWGRMNTPGNSYDDFKYLLDRAELILSEESNPVLRLWGTEEFSKKFLGGIANSIHKGIMKEIIDNNKCCNTV